MLDVVASMFVSFYMIFFGLFAFGYNIIPHTPPWSREEHEISPPYRLFGQNTSELIVYFTYNSSVLVGSELGVLGRTLGVVFSNLQ